MLDLTIPQIAEALSDVPDRPAGQDRATSILVADGADLTGTDTGPALAAATEAFAAALEDLGVTLHIVTIVEDNTVTTSVISSSPSD